jgi:hypothetical protein
MKIRQEITDMMLCFSKNIILSRHNFYEEKKNKYSILKNVVIIPLNGFKPIKCAYCSEICFDRCWNCGKPACEKHCHAIITSPIINTFCIECVSDLLKEYRINQEVKKW